MTQHIEIKNRALTIEDGEYALYMVISNLIKKIEALRLDMNG